MDFHVGQTFGDYAVTGILGAGGFGRVYKVEHLLTKRTEAMKVLAAEYATDTQIKRFKREMLILARLNHPNISVLHNAAYTEKQLVLFMAFIEGQTLETMFAGGRLPRDPGIGYIKQILLALEYAHQQGVVHRDVTPANVIITAAGGVKLTDFGLSKAFGDPQLTGLGEIIGALPYLAPEQLKSAAKQPDRRSDLYSVGAILYELLTGQKPFGANRRLSAVLADSENDPKPPSEVDPTIAPEWDEIIRRALARDPGSRYQSAGEFLNAIAQIGRASQPSRWIPHARAVGLGVAVSASLLLAMAGWSVSNRLRTVTLPISAGQFQIAPPNFAWVFTTPFQSQPRAYTKPRVSRHHAVVARTAPSVEPAKTEESSAAAVANTEANVVEPSKQNKRRFWSKFNVFKKNKSVAASNPAGQP